MAIDADRLAEQVELAYHFVDVLHKQVIALIKDVETQLAQERGIRCLQPRGYGYYTDSLSTSLERPHAQIARYLAVYLREFEDGIQNTPFDGNVPPICFLKVVLREEGLEHPEVRFGVLKAIEKAPGRPESKFEDIANILFERAFVGPAWSGRGEIQDTYEDAYVRFQMWGRGVRLADLPDSEAIAGRIVDPLLAMFSDAAE
jgi:hypothetical protein